MSGAAKRRWAAIGALMVAGGILTYVSFSEMDENLVYFWEPDELLAKGEQAYGATVRLGGFVQPGSYQWDAQALALRFNIATGMEPTSTSVAVRATGAPPQMFREGIGVVVEGSYDGKVFHGDRVIVKHDNEYQPPAEGERPDQLYKTLISEN